MGFAETEVVVPEDVGTVSVGLQVTDVPDISVEFANAGFGYQQNLFTVDTGTSAVGTRVGNQSLTHMIVFSLPLQPLMTTQVLQPMSTYSTT